MSSLEPNDVVDQFAVCTNGLWYGLIYA